MTAATFARAPSAAKRAAAVALVYFLHAPLAYMATARWGKALPGAAVVGIVVAQARAGRLRASAPRLSRIASVLYYAAVGVGLVVPGYFLFLVAPWYFPLPFVLALAVGLTRERRAVVALTAIAFLVALFQAYSLGLAASLVMLMAGTAWLVLTADGTVLLLPRAAGACAIAGLLVSIRLAAFLGGTPDHRAERIAAQPGVRVVVSPESVGGGSFWTRTPTEVRFLAESRDGRTWYAGTRGKSPGLRAIPKDGGPPRFLPMPGGVSDDMVLDRDGGRIFVGSYGAGAVYEVDPATLAVRRTLALPGVRVAIFRLAPDEKLLYLIPDDTTGVYLIDAERLALLGRAPHAEANTALLVDADRGRLVRLTNQGRVLLLDRFSLAPLRDKRLAGRLYFNVALDRRRGELFADCMSTGRLFALDRDTLATKRGGRNARGLRFLQYDAKRDLLYAGNFFTGDLVALDPATFAERARVYVGPRPRWVELTDDGDRLLVASGAGGVEVDLRTALRERR